MGQTVKLFSTINIQHTNRIHLKNYGWLLIICLLTYWPLTFGVFSVKNDAIHYFLPYRYNISESIRNFELPFWSPYIYNGYPIYGDMQSGVWNPIVWFFSIFSRYDLSIFHYECLIYIYISGLGMYKLVSRITDHYKTAFLISTSYMLSGYMLSGQLINWLASAAFIPIVLNYYTLLLKNHNYKLAVKTGVSLFFLFTAGYPSFFIILLYIIVILFFIELLKKKNLNPLIISHVILVVVFSILSLPALLSYLEVMPYYQRGNGIKYSDSIVNSMDLQQLFSFIFPSSIQANDIQSKNDISLSNLYVGIVPLIILISYPPKINKRNILLFALGIFALLFSLGDATPIRKFCFDYLPLLNSFRHPSQLRLFIILAILLLSAPGLKIFFTAIEKGETLLKFKYVISGLAIFIISILAIQIPQLLYSLSRFSNFSSYTDLLKIWIKQTPLCSTLLINGIIQLFFILASLICIKKRNLKCFTLTWILNLFIMAQLMLPVTFVSSHSVAKADSFIRSQPKGFPISNSDSSLSYNSIDALSDFEYLSVRNFYNKKPGISQITNTPSFLTSTEQFLKNKILYNYVSQKPIVYLADKLISTEQLELINITDSCNYAVTEKTDTLIECEKTKSAHVIKISSNQITVYTEANAVCFLVLTQNFIDGWSATIDKTPVNITKANISFIGINVPAGKHIVTFIFNSKKVRLAILPMAILLLALIITGILGIKNKLIHLQK